MTGPIRPLITAPATSLRAVGGAYEHVADALVHDHQILREESTMTEARDKALVARKAKRNPNRCNPDTEFTLGFDAGAAAAHETVSIIEWRDVQPLGAIVRGSDGRAYVREMSNGQDLRWYRPGAGASSVPPVPLTVLHMPELEEGN